MARLSDETLAELDRLRTERTDAIGALDDAGVRRNPSDDVASGIDKLAKDRDETLAEWNKVGSIFWPDREPDDKWSAQDVAEAVKEIRAAVETLRKERDEFKRIGQQFEVDARNHFEQSCKNLTRAESAEKERDGRTAQATVLSRELKDAEAALAEAVALLRGQHPHGCDRRSGLCECVSSFLSRHAPAEPTHCARCKGLGRVTAAAGLPCVCHLDDPSKCPDCVPCPVCGKGGRS